MLHEKKSRALIRSIIRDAKAGDSVYVFVEVEGEIQNETQKESDILRAVFDCDETRIKFVYKYNQATLGTLSIVLDYDSTPCEIINDFSLNEYTQNLILRAESKL